MLSLLTADAGTWVDRIVGALQQVASASQFGWLREAIGVSVFLASVVRIGYPLYADWRKTRGGSYFTTPQGPISYKHACEVALDENIRLGLRNDALERALAQARADLETAWAECEKGKTEMRLQFAKERAALTADLNELRVQLEACAEHAVGNGMGEGGQSMDEVRRGMGES